MRAGRPERPWTRRARSGAGTARWRVGAPVPPALLRAIVARAAGPAGGRAPVVLVDGRSGAGKTSFAAVLARALRPRWGAPQVVHLDRWYPGWSGLAAGTEILERRVLGPSADYPVWDWERHRVARVVRLDPARPLVVEGAGSLTARTRARADFAIWLEAPASVRKSRALGRDGDAFRPHWDQWAAEEREHLRRAAPRALADAIVDTAARWPQGHRGPGHTAGPASA